MAKYSSLKSLNFNRPKVYFWWHSGWFSCDQKISNNRTGTIQSPNVVFMCINLPKGTDILRSPNPQVSRRWTTSTAILIIPLRLIFRLKSCLCLLIPKQGTGSHPRPLRWLKGIFRVFRSSSARHIRQTSTYFSTEKWDSLTTVIWLWECLTDRRVRVYLWSVKTWTKPYVE